MNNTNIHIFTQYNGLGCIFYCFCTLSKVLGKHGLYSHKRNDKEEHFPHLNRGHTGW